MGVDLGLQGPQLAFPAHVFLGSEFLNQRVDTVDQTAEAPAQLLNLPRAADGRSIPLYTTGVVNGFDFFGELYHGARDAGRQHQRQQNAQHHKGDGTQKVGRHHGPYLGDDVLIGGQEDQLQAPLQLLRSAEVPLALDLQQGADRVGDQQGFSNGQIAQIGASVYLSSLVVQQQKTAVLGHRNQREQMGQLGHRQAAPQHPHAILQVRTGKGAALQPAGKAQPGLILAQKDVLPAAAAQSRLIPILIGNGGAAEYPAHVGNGAGGQEQLTDLQLRIHKQLGLEAVVQQKCYGIQLIGKAAVQIEFGVQVLQFILADLPAEQLAQLLVAGILVDQLIHCLGENATQTHVCFDHRLLGSDQLTGNGTPEQQIGCAVQGEQNGRDDAADNEKGPFFDAHGAASPLAALGHPAYRLRNSLGVMPVCFLKNLAK